MIECKAAKGVWHTLHAMQSNVKCDPFKIDSMQYVRSCWCRLPTISVVLVMAEIDSFCDVECSDKLLDKLSQKVLYALGCPPSENLQTVHRTRIWLGVTYHGQDTVVFSLHPSC